MEFYEKVMVHLILSKGELEYIYRLSKLKESLGTVGNASVNKDLARNDTDKNIHDCSESPSYYNKKVATESWLLMNDQKGKNDRNMNGQGVGRNHVNNCVRLIVM
ncbi:hypothetical protein Gotri_005689, partial [Gossypium trilobum]|nr:hypothetical protein [Gossypium trilobum]